MPAVAAREIAAWSDTLFIRDYTAKGSINSGEQNLQQLSWKE